MYLPERAEEVEDPWVESLTKLELDELLGEDWPPADFSLKTLDKLSFDRSSKDGDELEFLDKGWLFRPVDFITISTVLPSINPISWTISSQSKSSFSNALLQPETLTTCVIPSVLRTCLEAACSMFPRYKKWGIISFGSGILSPSLRALFLVNPEMSLFNNLPAVSLLSNAEVIFRVDSEDSRQWK